MTAPTVPDPAAQPLRRISPGQLAWLEQELDGWRRHGIVNDETASRIRAGYLARRRFSLMALWITLGSCFVAAGLIWLVAANLDRFSPLGRFVLVAAVWIGLTVGVEWFASRRHPEQSAWWVAAEALRLLPVAGYGATVFQAAQSLQVPTYEPMLILIWAAGALGYAYLVRGPAPLVVGVVLFAIWCLSFPLSDSDGYGTGVVIAASGLGFVAVAVAHRWSAWPTAAVLWRDLGIFGMLLGLFAACLPDSGIAAWRPLTVTWVIVAVVLGVVALVVGTQRERWTAALAFAGLGGAVLFTLWPVISGFSVDRSRGSAFLTSTLAVLVYLAVATGAAMLGALLDSQRITVVAGLMLALFAALQAFAVFAPILSGAVLFLTLGVILIAIGWAVDRGRRRLFPRVGAAGR